MLKFLIITVFAMIMLPWLPKVPTTIESCLCVVCKTLSTKSNTSMKKRTTVFMFEVTEWGHSLDLAIYSIY